MAQQELLDGSGYSQDDSGADPWGRRPGDPWYGVDPTQQHFGSPWAPGYTPGPGEGDPEHNPNFGPVPTKLGPPPPGPNAGGGSNLSSLLQAYPGQFAPPSFGTRFNEAVGLLGPVPEYTAPSRPQIDPFSAPSFNDVLKDPGYIGRKQTGEQALMNNKAAQGLVRTGGTLKDLLNYNQDFASQEYGNVFDRSLTTHNTNANTKLGVFDRDLAATQAEFAPKLYGWKTKGDVGMQGERDAWDQSYKQFLTDYDIWHNNQNDWTNAAQWDLGFGRDSAAM